MSAGRQRTTVAVTATCTRGEVPAGPLPGLFLPPQWHSSWSSVEAVLAPWCRSRLLRICHRIRGRTPSLSSRPRPSPTSSLDLDGIVRQLYRPLDEPRVVHWGLGGIPDTLFRVTSTAWARSSIDGQTSVPFRQRISLCHHVHLASARGSFTFIYTHFYTHLNTHLHSFTLIYTHLHSFSLSFSFSHSFSLSSENEWENENEWKYGDIYTS